MVPTTNGLTASRMRRYTTDTYRGPGLVLRVSLAGSERLAASAPTIISMNHGLTRWFRTKRLIERSHYFNSMTRILMSVSPTFFTTWVTGDRQTVLPVGTSLRLGSPFSDVSSTTPP